MVVDTSVLVAILFEEPEASALTDIIDRAAAPKLSVISRMEATMVYIGRRAKAHSKTVTNLIEVLRLQVAMVDERQMDFAVNAFLRFGKGRHPARLNLGDCFSYGLAASLEEPLLFKGGDFLKTDIVPAWQP